MKVTTEAAKGGKIRIYADGEYAFSVDAAVWYSYSYYDGDELTAEQLEGIKNDSLSRRAYSSALRLLSARAHSEKELAAKLRVKHSDFAVEYAVEKCRELGFIDDERFAEDFARELLERRGYSPQRIKSELISRGVNREIAENAVMGLDISVTAVIIDLLNSKYVPKTHDEKEKRRIINALTRLGYDYGDIKTAMSQAEEWSVFPDE